MHQGVSSLLQPLNLINREWERRTVSVMKQIMACWQPYERLANYQSRGSYSSQDKLWTPPRSFAPTLNFNFRVNYPGWLGMTSFRPRFGFLSSLSSSLALGILFLIGPGWSVPGLHTSSSLAIFRLLTKTFEPWDASESSSCCSSFTHSLQPI